MNARRAAVLLRCQRVREQARRRDLARADAASAEAAQAVLDARAARAAGQAAGAERLQRAYGGLAGRLAGTGDLAALPALRTVLASEDHGRARVLDEARAVAGEARRAAAAAQAALLVEARATEKRAKLAERSRMLWRRAVDAAEESERDEQVIDTWRPA